MRKNWEDESSERELRGALKDALRPAEGESTVDFCRRLIVAGQFGAWDDGRGEMLLDTFSASAVVAVHDGLSEAARPKLLAMPMSKAVDVCFNVINKARGK
jgi:hypothetical protein